MDLLGKVFSFPFLFFFFFKQSQKVRTRTHRKPIWEEYSQQIKASSESSFSSLIILTDLWQSKADMWAVFLTQIFFDSRVADSKMAIDCSTVQLKHVCERQELCDYSPGFSKTDLKVFYIHSVFSCRAEPDKMLSWQ